MATRVLPKCCCQCSRKPTKNRSINPNTAVCNECSGGDENTTIQSESEAAAVDIDDEAALGEIRFGDLKKWLHYELHTNIKQIVKDELKAELGEIRNTFLI